MPRPVRLGIRLLVRSLPVALVALSLTRLPAPWRVVFTNDDTVAHEMSSDPHPTHTDCPQINQVGFLRPGETRETGNFVRPEECGYHDHINPTNATLTGTITVTE